MNDNLHIPPAFYCSDAYSCVYFVMLPHPSSLVSSRFACEIKAFASLVSTTVYDASKQRLVKYAG